MHDEETGPQEDNVEKSNQSKEQGHVYPGFIANLLLHHDGIKTVQDGAKCRHGIAKSNLPRGFVWK